MNLRENFISIVKRRGYEYMPVQFTMCPSLSQRCQKDLTDMEHSALLHFWPVTEAEGIPVKSHPREVYLKYFKDLKEGTTIDEFGIAHEPGSAAALHMTYMRHPMADMEDIEEMQAYPFPEFYETDEIIERIRLKNEEEKKKDRLVMGSMQCTIWETAWYIRGMENLMMDMLSEDPMADFILDKITEIAIQKACFYMKTGCDILYLGDDVGMQKTLMMSQPLYRSWLKPRLKKVIDAARAINPDVLVFYHSCGYVKEFIPDFIEVGVDVLNPVQPECMDFQEIHDEFGDKISFHGTIGTQTLMPFGTPEEVREKVAQNLDIAGKKGGLLIAPTHMLEDEVPLENIKAYVDACREFRG